MNILQHFAPAAAMQVKVIVTTVYIWVCVIIYVSW